MNGTAEACVGLGANLGDAAASIRTALGELDGLPGTRLRRVSSLYRTAAVGGPAQPDYLNAVALIDTRLAPRDLLDALLGIEVRHGRVRGEINGPRTLDLDLILYAGRTIAEPGLSVPHPRAHERRFVLEPLAEIAPDMEIPGRGSVTELLAACGHQRVLRMESA